MIETETQEATYFSEQLDRLQLKWNEAQNWFEEQKQEQLNDEKLAELRGKLGQVKSRLDDEAEKLQKELTVSSVKTIDAVQDRLAKLRKRMRRTVKDEVDPDNTA